MCDWKCYLQSLNQDLEEALQEKERVKEQAQEYIVEVKRCEELLSSKVIYVQIYFLMTGSSQFMLIIKGFSLLDIA